MGQETKNAFVEMFSQDMTPSAAWEEHRRMIKEKYPDDYHLKFGDRHICPDYFWCLSSIGNGLLILLVVMME